MQTYIVPGRKTEDDLPPRRDRRDLSRVEAELIGRLLDGTGYDIRHWTGNDATIEELNVDRLAEVRSGQLQNHCDHVPRP